MTQEYTPTTEKVKQAYSGLHEKNYYDFTVMQREENFDRWLAAHDAEVRDKALTPIRDIVKDEPSPCAWHDKPDDIVTCGWKHDIIAIRNILKEES